jgi:DNA-binding transcriptional ArsR family regulator
MKSGKSMQELSEWDGLKTFFDPRLIKALGHPVREHILAVLNERIASASEIAEELGADVSSFYHHIEELEKLECIEKVKTSQKRGAKEHFFRANRTVFFHDEAWQRLPASLQGDLTVSFMQAIFDDATVAMDAGTFDRKSDRHVSWIPGRLDERGWKEARDLMDETLGRIMAIREQSAARLVESGEEGLSATLAILAFETPRSNDSLGDLEKAPGRERGPRPTSTQ